VRDGCRACLFVTEWMGSVSGAEEDVMSFIVEIRAAEGGADAKALVLEQVEIYARLAARRGL